MSNLADIKYRINTISDTRQITKAMETVSIAKMRKAMQIYRANEVFFSRILEAINDIVLHTGDIDSPYILGRKDNRALFIVIASDKGLCGGYNHNVLSRALQEIDKRDKSKLSIFTVGYMAQSFFEKQNLEVDVAYKHISTSNSQSDASKIADNVLSMFDLNLIDEIHIVYTTINHTGETAQDVLQLLPLDRQKIEARAKDTISMADEEYIRELEYEPSIDDVLDVLVRQYLTGVIYGALVHSSAAEHSSRRNAMSSATSNASDILDRLNLEYNRERQASVTNEILEIVTASSGVE